MSTQQVLQIGGAAIGSFFGMPQLGFMIGSGLAALVPVDGPDPGDLTAPQINAGSPMWRVHGSVRRTGSPIWMSAFHAVESGGKGGEPPSVSFTVDMLYLVADGTNVQALLKTWVNKKLQFTALSTSPLLSLAASLVTSNWESIELRDGNPAQLPWSVHEAAKGVGNVSAQRGYCTIAIKGLNCGGSKALPLVEFEISTNATPGTLVDAGDGLLCHFDADGAAGFVTSAIGPDMSKTNGATLNTTGGQFSGRGVVASAAQTFIASGITGTLAASWRFEMWCKPSSFSGDLFSLESTVTGHHFTLSYPAGFSAFLYNLASSTSVQSGGLGAPGNTLIGGVFNHIAVQWRSDTTALDVFCNGVLISGFGGGVQYLPTDMFNVLRLGGGGGSGTLEVDEAYLHVDLPATEYYGATYAVPSAPFPGGDSAYSVWTANPVTLSSIIDAELARNEAINLADFDTTLCDPILVDEYQCSGAAADAIAKVCDMYYVDLVPGNPLRFVPRGQAVVATLTNAEVGAPGQPFAGLKEDNDDEQPAIAGLQFPDRLNNHNPGFVQADRLQPESANARNLSTLVGFEPTAANGRAIAYNLLRAAARFTGEARWSDRRTTLQPGDAIVLPDELGNQYNVLIRSSTYDGSTHQAKLELNDTSALVYAGIASTQDRNAITVAPAPEAEFLALDVPLLRDADNDAGYVGLSKTGSTAGSRWLDSPDDTTYTQQAVYANNATFGFVTAASGSFARGVLFDESSRLTVNVGAGTLASATRAALLASRSLNAFAVGVDGRMVLGQYRTATLVTAGIYTLTGLVNMGAQGTEQYCAAIVAGDSFALLGTAGTARIPRSSAALGVPFYVKAVADGATEASATGVAFTDNGVALMPLSPVHPRTARNVGSGDIAITWIRRTRMETRFGGPLGDSCPLGEAAEQYRARLYTDGTYTTLLRDLGIVTTAAVTYTSAQRTADGHTPITAPLYLDLRMLSDVVGEGYPLQAAA